MPSAPINIWRTQDFVSKTNLFVHPKHVAGTVIRIRSVKGRPDGLSLLPTITPLTEMNKIIEKEDPFQGSRSHPLSLSAKLVARYEEREKETQARRAELEKEREDAKNRYLAAAEEGRKWMREQAKREQEKLYNAGQVASGEKKVVDALVQTRYKEGNPGAQASSHPVVSTGNLESGTHRMHEHRAQNG